MCITVAQPLATRSLCCTNIMYRTATICSQSVMQWYICEVFASLLLLIKLPVISIRQHSSDLRSFVDYGCIVAVTWREVFILSVHYCPVNVVNGLISQLPDKSHSKHCMTREVKIKVHTLDIAPLRSESPPQKRSGMTRVLKGFHSFTCTPTRLSAIGRSHTCLCLPSRSWYSFTDPGGMEG